MISQILSILALGIVSLSAFAFGVILVFITHANEKVKLTLNIFGFIIAPLALLQAAGIVTIAFKILFEGGV